MAGRSTLLEDRLIKEKIEPYGKWMEQSIQNNRALKAALEKSQASLFHQDLDLRFTWVYNPLLGMTEKDIIGKHDDEIFPFDVARAMIQVKKRVIDSGIGTRMNIKIPLDGRVYWLDAILEPSRNSSDEIIGLDGVAFDITPIKEAEAAQLHREERLHFLLESMTDCVVTIDKDLHITYANKAALKKLRLPVEKVLKRDVDNLLPHINTSKIYQAIRKALQNRANDTVTEGYEFPDGRYGWYETRIYPVPEGLLCIARDITGRQLAEQERRKIEERYRVIVETTNEGIWILDSEHKMAFVNQRAEEMLGYEPGELIGQDILSLVDDQDVPMARRQLEERRKGKSGRYEIKFKRKDGNKLWSIISATPIVDPQGRYMGVTTMLLDITEQKNVEDALRKREEWFKSIYEESAIGAEIYDSKGFLVDANKACLDIFGIEKVSDVKGFKLFDDPNLDQNIKDKILAGQDVKAEIIFDFDKIKKDRLYPTSKSGLADLYVIIKRITQNRGQSPWGYLVLVQDISERKKSEEAIRASEQKFRGLFETMRDGVARVDLKGQFVETNPAFCEMTGYSDEELRKLTVWDITPLKWHLQQNKLKMELLEKTYSSIYSKEYKRKDGTTFPVLSMAWAIKDSNGNPVGAWGIIRDITELIKAEEKIRESNSRYIEIFDSVMEGICYVDTNETVRMCNPELAHIFGAEAPSELIGRNVFDFSPEEQRHIIAEQTALRKQNISSKYEIDAITLKGERKTLLISASPRFDKGQFTGTFAAIVDISANKKAEDALRQSQEQLALALKGGDLAVYDLNAQTGEMRGNARWFEMTGYGPDEIIPSVDGIKRMIHPDDVSAASERLEAHIEGKTDFYEDEFRVRVKSGEWKWIFTSGQAVERDSRGRAIRVVGTIRDITVRKHAEEALRTSQMRLELALKGGNLAYFDRDLTTNQTIISDRWAEMVGYEPPEVQPVFDFIVKNMHPDDLASTLEKMDAHLSGKTPFYEAEWRIKHKDGHYIWVLARGQVMERDQAGKPLRMVGTHMDITERKQAEIRDKARYVLINNLRTADDINTALNHACQVICDVNLFKQAAFILHSRESGGMFIGKIGLEKSSLAVLSSNVVPNMESIMKLAREEYRVGNSYIVPSREAIAAANSSSTHEMEIPIRLLPSEIGDLLLLPIRNGNDLEGWLEIAIPQEYGRPSIETIRYLEEIVSMVMGRVREIRHEERMRADSNRINEKNIALREIVAAIEEEKAKIRKEIAETIDQVLRPSLNRLVHHDGTVNKTYFDLLKYNLEELSAATGGPLRIGAKLSPREIEICTLIKNGASSKEIAEALNIAVITVQKHRELIRKKLGLTNKNTNLTSYLRTLEL